jgi:hypothetical protein
VFAAVFPGNVRRSRTCRYASSDRLAVGFRQRLVRACVHAVAEDVVAFDDNVADILMRAGAGLSLVALGESCLCGDSEFDSGDD